MHANALKSNLPSAGKPAKYDRVPDARVVSSARQVRRHKIEQGLQSMWASDILWGHRVPWCNGESRHDGLIPLNAAIESPINGAARWKNQPANRPTKEEVPRSH